MKKVLLGLLALSAVSMAAATDLTKPATGGADVFQTGQEGAISITGTVTSDIPTVKYVVFASANGTDMEDTLTLPQFTMSENEATAGFKGGFPLQKVFVKRVSNANKAIDLADTDRVSMKVSGDPFFTNISGGYAMKYIEIDTPGEKFSMLPTAGLSKTKMEEIIENNPILKGNFAPDTRGVFYKKSTASGYYAGSKSLLFSAESKGVVKVGEVSSTLDERVTLEERQAINNGFAGGVSYSPDFKLNIKVQ